MKTNKECEIFSGRGRVLIHIFGWPDCTVKELADRLYLTRRSVWGMIGELRRAGLIEVRKEGRCHYYKIAKDAVVYHPTVGGRAVRIPLRRSS